MGARLGELDPPNGLKDFDFNECDKSSVHPSCDGAGSFRLQHLRQNARKRACDVSCFVAFVVRVYHHGLSVDFVPDGRGQASIRQRRLNRNRCHQDLIWI